MVGDKARNRDRTWWVTRRAVCQKGEKKGGFNANGRMERGMALGYLTEGIGGRVGQGVISGFEGGVLGTQR